MTTTNSCVYKLVTDSGRGTNWQPLTLLSAPLTLTGLGNTGNLAPSSTTASLPYTFQLQMQNPDIFVAGLGGNGQDMLCHTPSTIKPGGTQPQQLAQLTSSAHVPQIQNMQSSLSTISDSTMLQALLLRHSNTSSSDTSSTIAGYPPTGLDSLMGSSSDAMLSSFVSTNNSSHMYALASSPRAQITAAGNMTDVDSLLPACNALAASEASTSLYIKNLSVDADELFLYQRFAPYGALTSCKIKSDPITGKCRGVAFVNYTTHEAAVRAMQQLHGSRGPNGRQLHITLQAPRAVRALTAAAAASVKHLQG